MLGEVGLIAAEDTRTTRKLLNHYNIKTRCTSYHDHNREIKIPVLLEALATKDVALVSEAGTPQISDPGYELVHEAIKAGVKIVPIPGASAVTACLPVCDLRAKGTLFLGFLPRRKGERRHLLESLTTQSYTIVAFEAPHRLRGSLEDALAVLGDREIAVCREMTKVHEEVFRGTLSQSLTHFSNPRGEFTLVIGGAPHTEAIRDQGWAQDELTRLKRQGVKAREAVAVVARETNTSKKEVYRLWLAVDLGSP